MARNPTHPLHTSRMEQLYVAMKPSSVRVRVMVRTREGENLILDMEKFVDFVSLQEVERW